MLSRYVTRRRLELPRLSTNGARQEVYQLKTPYQNGTTHFVFEPALHTFAQVQCPEVVAQCRHAVFSWIGRLN